ncbi:VWA domain-containing protein [Nonomuraea sp. NPDC050786]|uniref:vWA domain-containing protein n=1 Tax=Nonomuraea sp. NPDC050786 TaxID=3154840 RepID=UPI00340D0B97
MSIDALPRVQPAKSRLPMALVLDTSSSMREGDRIGELNAALGTWRTELRRNSHLARHGEIAMITFGHQGVRVVDPTGRGDGEPAEPFASVEDFAPRPLVAGGVTPMIEAIRRTFELIAARKQQIRQQNRVLQNRPLVYLITDGVPTDDRGVLTDRWRDLAPAIRAQENGNHLLFFAIGVQGADMDVLAGLAPRSHFNLADLDFTQVLRLVSTSMDRTSRSSRMDQPADEAYEEVNQLMTQNEEIRKYLESNG